MTTLSTTSQKLITFKIDSLKDDVHIFEIQLEKVKGEKVRLESSISDAIVQIKALGDDLR